MYYKNANTYIHTKSHKAFTYNESGKLFHGSHSIFCVCITCTPLELLCRLDMCHSVNSNTALLRQVVLYSLLPTYLVFKMTQVLVIVICLEHLFTSYS